MIAVMASPLPAPADLSSLVVRTDFTDDAAWEAVRAAVEEAAGDGHATWVDDRSFAGASVQSLVDADTAADEDERLFRLFVADATTMGDAERPLLAVDLADEPGRTFRVAPDRFADVSANLCIANLDFADIADNSGGTYRGFPTGT
jgi:hypothetical protein